MGTSNEEMIALEKMAKLDLSETERDWLAQKISFLKDSFQDILTIDTKDIAPLISVVDMKNVFREDIAKKMVSRSEILENAPEKNGGYFQVPQTIE